MPLDKQVVGVNFAQGLDTQTDKRLVLPGKMVALQNATMQEEDTYKRRNGNTALVTGTAINGLAILDDQLLALDGSSLGSYSPAAQALESAGSVDNLTMTHRELARDTGGQCSYDAATSSGVTCYVWRSYDAAGTATGCKVTILDETTGATLLPVQFLKSGTNVYNPHVVLVTGAFIIFYVENTGAPGTLYARVVQVSAPGTLGAETTLRSDIDSGVVAFDACASGASAFVYYVTNDATTSTRAIAVTRSGTTPSVSAGPLNVTSQAQIGSLHIAGVTLAMYSASLVGVFLVTDSGAGTPGMWAGVLTTAMAVSVAAALKDATAAVLNVANITAVLNGSTMYVYSDDYGRSGEATATARLVRRTGLNSGNVITSAAATWINSMTRPNGTNGPFIVGKAFLVGSTVYVPMAIVEAGTGTLQNSWFLLNDSARVVARALYGSYGGAFTGAYSLPAAFSPASSKYTIVVGERTLAQFTPNLTGIGPDVLTVSVTGMSTLTLDFSASGPLVNAPVGPEAYFGNAMLSVFDGVSASEAAFNLFPEVVTAAAGGAGNVPDGAHGIVALYEWFDASGQRHQSAPSVAITLTVAAGPKTCTVTVPTLNLSQKTGITVVAYATTAGGTLYYRVNAVSAPVANSTTAPTVSITYNVTDANLIVGELLYTTGGILPNDAPPPCSTLAVHQNRIFINPSDDPLATQFSQPAAAGFGVQWNETLRFYVEATGGNPTAYASIDDKLIIFRPRKIGVLFGQGPATTGLGGSYQVQDLPTDVGCSEPRSVLVMPEGVIFKSTSKGWYRLGRDLNLQWIGEGVQEWDSQGVTSAVLLDTQKECRFTTNDSEGLTLVYHYQRREWSTYSSFTGVDAVWWPGGNAYVRATATKLIKELPPTAAGLAYGDLATTALGAIGGTAPIAQTGSVIPMTFRTGWLKPGEALQAFQRIWRVLLTGAATGYPPPYAVLTAAAGPSSNPNSIFVADTTIFTADQLLGNGLNFDLGNSSYEDNPNPYTIISATRIDLSVPLAVDHAIGAGVRGTIPTTVSAAGTLVVKLYFDGNDSAAYQTITISDVSTLVNGNAWNVRLQPNLQKCDAIMMEVVSTPAVQDPGASLNFSGMTMELGVKKGAKKFNAAQTK